MTTRLTIQATPPVGCDIIDAVRAGITLAIKLDVVVELDCNGVNVVCFAEDDAQKLTNAYTDAIKRGRKLAILAPEDRR